MLLFDFETISRLSRLAIWDSGKKLSIVMVTAFVDSILFTVPGSRAMTSRTRDHFKGLEGLECFGGLNIPKNLEQGNIFHGF